MKILLTGSTGQLGKELIKSKPNHIELIIPNRNILNLEKWYDLIALKKIDSRKCHLEFLPYQFMWISNKY